MEQSQNDHRVFENNLLERLSKTNAYVVIVAYMVLSAAMLGYFSLSTDLSVLVQIALFFAGLFVFSLVEYLVHRYLFHSHETPDKGNITYRLHHIHHDHPRDKKRLALPLPVGLVVASVVYLVFWLILGKFTPFFFPGFIIGYALYLLIHYLIHTRRPPKNQFRILWTNHHIHHYKDDTKAYGVTSPLWDIIFKTTP
jgi:sterol desaturase/sphingolipid hydroxylase (fatty acid hydroxylase superfamily)